MVGFNPQLVALLAAFSASSASAIALPHATHPLAQYTLSMPPPHDNIHRRSAPVAPLPDAFKQKTEYPQTILEGARHEVRGEDEPLNAKSVSSEGARSTPWGIPVQPIHQRSPSHTHMHERSHDHHHGHHHHHHHTHSHNHKRKSIGPLRLNNNIQETKATTPAHKRALINIGPGYRYRTGGYRYRPTFQHSGHGSLLHLNIGKRGISVPNNQPTSLVENLQDERNSETPLRNAQLPGWTASKRDEYDGGLTANVGGVAISFGRPYSRRVLASRRHRHHHHHHHHGHHHSRAQHGRRTPDGVEGVIDIVSPVVDSPKGRKIASLLLSDDPSSQSAFVLNASNSTATHVFLVPSKVTTVSADDDPHSTTFPVGLRVPVYSPDDAALVDYCATYDPNPPSPAPLTAQPCTNEVTSHFSQIFSYNPTSGVIIPMWAVSPSSSDPAVSSEPSPIGATLASSSSTSTASLSPPTSSGSISRRSPPAYIVQDEEEPCAENPITGTNGSQSPMKVNGYADGNAEGAQQSPLSVSLIFTPSAEGILPSKEAEVKPTTFFPGGVPVDPSVAGAETEAEEDGGDDGDDAMGEQQGGPELSTTPTATLSSQATSSSTSSQLGPSLSPGPVADANGWVASYPNEAVESVEELADVKAKATSSLGTPSPSMTPVLEAASPYSWMFNPKF